MIGVLWEDCRRLLPVQQVFGTHSFLPGGADTRGEKKEQRVGAPQNVDSRLARSAPLLGVF